MNEKTIAEGKAAIVRSMMGLIETCIAQRVDQWFDVIMKAIETKEASKDYGYD
jgi:hypothetical protein